MNKTPKNKKEKEKESINILLKILQKKKNRHAFFKG